MYLVHGGEPLLVQEACDAIIQAAQRQGVAERSSFHSDTHDWESLPMHLQSQSMLASRKLLHVRLWPGSLKNRAAKPLQNLAAMDKGADIVLVQANDLNPASQRTAWFKALAGASVEVAASAVPARELIGWLMRRAEAKGFELTEAAAKLIAARTEGNLSASAQEIDKIALGAPAAPVDRKQLHEAIGDSTSFTIQRMIDCALGGNAARALRMHWRLRNTAASSYQIVAMWRFVLLPLQAAAASPHPHRALQSARVSQSRIGLLIGALERCPADLLNAALDALASADAQCKGAALGDPWRTLADICVLVSGVKLPWQTGAYLKPPWHPQPRRYS